MASLNLPHCFLGGILTAKVGCQVECDVAIFFFSRFCDEERADVQVSCSFFFNRRVWGEGVRSRKGRKKEIETRE